MPTALTNTLNGMQVQSPEDALNQQIQQIIAQSAAQVPQANQAADQAFGQYQQAAQAPPPMISGLAGLLPGLLGNVASILTQNPTYGQQAQEHQKTTQEALFARRSENLKALHDHYDNLANAAQQIGNRQAEMENRLQAVRFGAQYQTMQDKANKEADLKREREVQKAESDRNAARIAGEQAIAKGKLTADTANLDYLSKLTRKAGNGAQWFDLTGYTGKKKEAVRENLIQSGVLPVEKEDAASLKDIATVRDNNQKLLNVIGKYLAKDPTGRFITAPGNRLSQILQNKADLAAVGQFNDSAIRTARAISGRAGFRMQQATINLILKNAVKPTDTLDAAQRKVDFIETQLKSVEDGITGDPAGWSGGTATTTGSSDPLGIR